MADNSTTEMTMNRSGAALARRGMLAVAAAAALLSAPFAHAAPGDAPPPPPPNGLQTQQANGIDYISGGVGLDESTTLKKEAARWPLSLEFIGGERNFVADVPVKITDGRGATVFEATSQGPYMLVRLKPGHYTVHASYSGREQTRQVNVGKKGARARFDWRVR
ncbi:carboxypeptidase-like regulatory domain-containing protein [Chitinasiproducens palmae]|uniref:Carboxypeptidase regulatory-like domain-containing protein n=1 Tax=Chitinasiproducens palmae TaxID=1770053 RepID=A0A1H2PWA7_9BURK|nr:carboxypeptidase-like regulatory domain-containing protein [Chitinasiproducens palmae]SDV51618.1 hypothetical protein SAMN05216551_1207 [Chitinasiproducens palmae]